MNRTCLLYFDGLKSEMLLNSQNKTMGFKLKCASRIFPHKFEN